MFDKIALVIEACFIGNFGTAFVAILQKVAGILDPGVDDDLQDGFSCMGLDQMGEAIGTEADCASNLREGQRFGVVFGDEIKRLADMAV